VRQPQFERLKSTIARQAAIDEARRYLHLDDPGAALYRETYSEPIACICEDDDEDARDDDERSWVSHATKAAVRAHMPPASAGRGEWSAAIVRRVRYVHLGKRAAGARELELEAEYADGTADVFLLPRDADDVRSLFYYSAEPARALGVPAIFSRNQWSQEFEFVWQQARRRPTALLHRSLERAGLRQQCTAAFMITARH
jgi:hypothetical protein